jgi:hypothetical protein
MRRKLLVAGGIVQVLLAALHIGMFFAPLPQDARPMAYVFNGGVTAVVLFFAYVSLFQSEKLVGTPMGRLVCWFAALFVLQWAVVGIVAPGFNEPGLTALLVPLALVYGFVAAPARPWPAREAAQATESVSAA